MNILKLIFCILVFLLLTSGCDEKEKDIYVRLGEYPQIVNSIFYDSTDLIYVGPEFDLYIKQNSQLRYVYRNGKFYHDVYLHSPKNKELWYLAKKASKETRWNFPIVTYLDIMVIFNQEPWYANFSNDGSKMTFYQHGGYSVEYDVPFSEINNPNKDEVWQKEALNVLILAMKNIKQTVER